MAKNMTRVWTIGEIAEIVGAKNDVSPYTDVQVASFSNDARELADQALFVPLIGQHADGHTYIQQAIDNQAVCAFWARDLAEAPDGFPVIQVEDPLQALQDLSQHYLEELNPLLVAITGSNGKTTTKDMTEAVLSAKYKSYKTQGNKNSTIGLPLTILMTPQDTEALILEMGMSHAGEIHQMSLIAKPHIAVITMSGESHIENLGSLGGVADAKMEIIDGLSKDGLLIYNGDQEILQSRAKKHPEIRQKTFGLEKENDLFAFDIETGIDFTKFKSSFDPSKQAQIPVPGSYNVNNAMAAILVGLDQGIDYETILGQLADFQLSKNRLEWLEGPGGSHILNDAYNASPTSMRASVSFFSHLSLPGRKWLVLGDMLELGPISQEAHAGIKEAILAEGLDQVVLFGTEMQALKQALEADPAYQDLPVAYFKDDRTSLTQFLKDNLQEGDHLLFKSSFGTKLLQVIHDLTN